MGRRDAVAFTLELVAEWRRLGARVTFEPGWETRGNGYAADYEGGIIHHTAFGSSSAVPFPARRTLIDGRPDLPGPLCNSAGPWCSEDDPWIHVIAAYPANHAGASGGRSMGPLPVTGLFNPRVWGHEIDYGGNAPMAPGQHVAALIVAKGIASVLNRSIEYVRAHAETSVTGKWDPGYATGKTIDMAAFRREAAAYEGDDMPTVAEFWNAKTVHPMTGKDTIVIDLVKDGVRQATRAAVDGAIARKLAEAAAKGVALSQADVDRISAATEAKIRDEIAAGYDVTLTPKTDPV